jgi:hypothetical protein
MAGADLPMYRAKANGGGTYRFFDRAMQRAGLDRIEIGLHRAIEHNQLDAPLPADGEPPNR